MNKTLLFFFLFFGFHLGLLANTELKIQHWQQSHGLPTQEVISFSQDNDGYIILHCRNGAYRFDGYNSYPVRLQPSQSSGDSVRLQGEKLLFYGDTLTGDYRQLLKANGEYWVTGRAGFGYLDTTTRTVTWLNQPGELPDNDCDNPALAPDGKIWFAMPLMGVGFYDSNNKRLYSIQNINQYPSFLNAHEIFSVLLDRAITALFLDRNNCLWIATRKDGLYKISFEPQRYQFFRFEFEKEAEIGRAHV